MTERPLLLITNDDGVHSPGLLAAAEAVADLGELLIVAPATQQTSMGRAFASGPGVGAIERVVPQIGGRGIDCYAVTGSPALAVTHAMLELTDRQPSLCISGMNYGENIGGDLGISGTIGAAMQATAYGIPGLAVSVQVDVSEWHSKAQLDWTAAKHFTRRLTIRLLEDGMPDGVSVMNLNIPRNAKTTTELRITSQSRVSRYLHMQPVDRVLSEPVRLKIKVNPDNEGLEPDSDILAVICDEVVSVTPLTSSMSAATTWRP
jgi:5'-nucleotidase